MNKKFTYLAYIKTPFSGASWTCPRCKRTVQDSTSCPYCG